MSFVVVFAANHVDGHPKVVILVNKLINAPQVVFGVWQESQYRQLESYGNAGLQRVLLPYALT